MEEAIQHASGMGTSAPTLDAPAPRELEPLKTVYELTEAVSRACGLDEIYEAALHGLELAVGTDRTSILLYDDPDGVMRFKAWHGLSDAYRSAVEGHSPWSRDVRDPEPLLVPDVESDPGLSAYGDLFRRERIGSLGFIPLVSRGRLIGKFMVYFDRPHLFSDEEVRLAETIAAHVAFAVERQRNEGALTYLAGASAALDASLDYGATLEEVARLTVPYLADWVLVETLDAEGVLHPVAAVHADPQRGDTLTKLLAWRSAEGSSLALEAIESGHPAIAARADEALASEFGGRPEPEELLNELGARSAVALPLRARGRVLGAITMVSGSRSYDAPDLALAEDLARRGATALDNARLYREAQESDRRKEEFLAVLAHELRNPLMPLLTCLELMRAHDGDPESLRRWREIMERQIRTLARLVDDLLDVSRITRGKIELQKQAIELGTVITRAAETTRPFFQSRRITLALDVEPEVSFECDPLRLEQVLANLLNNAAKFTPPGGRVEVTGAREEDRVVVRVRDHGIGMESDMLNRVFDLFVQGVKPSGGLGIGLTLARTLVELHGGTVRAESEGMGSGTEFIVRLPVGAPAEGQAFRPSPSEASRVPLRPARRALIVDDNLDGATTLAEALRLRGHEIHVAHDGRTALLEAERMRPDLVLLDLGLPDIDGFEVAARLRMQPALSRTKLIAVSGYGQEQHQKRSAQSGFAAHLVKPIDLTQLEELMHRLSEETAADDLSRTPSAD